MDRDIPRLIITVGPTTQQDHQKTETILRDFPDAELLYFFPGSEEVAVFPHQPHMIDWDAVNRLFTKEKA